MYYISFYSFVKIKRSSAANSRRAALGILSFCLICESLRLGLSRHTVGVVDQVLELVHLDNLAHDHTAGALLELICRQAIGNLLGNSHLVPVGLVLVENVLALHQNHSTLGGDVRLLQAHSSGRELLLINSQDDHVLGILTAVDPDDGADSRLPADDLVPLVRAHLLGRSLALRLFRLLVFSRSLGGLFCLGDTCQELLVGLVIDIVDHLLLRQGGDRILVVQTKQALAQVQRTAVHAQSSPQSLDGFTSQLNIDVHNNPP